MARIITAWGYVFTEKGHISVSYKNKGGAKTGNKRERQNNLEGEFVLYMATKCSSKDSYEFLFLI